MEQITVTDSNSWEREKFSFIFNDPSQQFVDFVTEAATEHPNLSIIKDTEHTQESIKRVNRLSHNSYMNRYGFYEEPIELKTSPNQGYDELFYKAVGIRKILEVK